MNTHNQLLRLFIVWLFLMAVAAVTYVLYFGPLERQVVEVMVLGALIALSVLYFGVRATRFGKNVVTLLALGWLMGTYIYFSLMRPSIDVRLSMLILLVISLALNIALSVIIKKKALSN